MRTLFSVLSQFMFSRFPAVSDLLTLFDDECPPETEAEHEALVAAALAQLEHQLPPGAITLYPGTDIPCVELRDPRVSEIFRR